MFTQEFINNNILNREVDHIKYGKGTIVSCSVNYCAEISAERPYDVMVDIKFGNDTKKFSLSRVLESKSLTMKNDSMLSSEFVRINNEIREDIAEKERLKQEELAEQRRLEKIRLQMQKFEEKKERDLKKLRTLTPEKLNKVLGSPDTYYKQLGWIVRHVRRLHAGMPDYMEDWFVSNFGDVDRNVSDSNKKTPGGFISNWALSFTMEFDSEVPYPLNTKCTGKNKKIISNVRFIWGLLDDHNLKFGRNQDVDEVVKTVPTQYLEQFYEGYNSLYM